MKYLKWTGLVLAFFTLLILVLGLVVPKTISSEESISINSFPDQVWNLINTLQKQTNWSPWKEKDPNQIIEHFGEPGEIGSGFTWQGNSKVGKGKQTIIEVIPNQRISSDILISGLFSSTTKTSLNLFPEGSQTKVKWSFDSKMPYPFNAFKLLFDPSKYISEDFKLGLSKLKNLAETKTEIVSGTSPVKLVNSNGLTYLGIRKIVPMNKISTFFQDSYAKITDFLIKNKIEPLSSPTGLYFKFDNSAKTVDLMAGLSVPPETKIPKGLTTFELKKGPLLIYDYYGSYAKSSIGHIAIGAFSKENGLIQGVPAIEVYVSDPAIEKDTSKWLTQILYPVKK
jgi:effector-binding domain-containing protein